MNLKEEKEFQTYIMGANNTTDRDALVIYYANSYYQVSINVVKYLEANYPVKFIFNSRIGAYIVLEKSTYITSIPEDMLINKEVTKVFPYNILRDYSSSSQLTNFSIRPYSYKFNNTPYDSKYLTFLPTIGIEFETSGGVIPQEYCYKYGLIPLKDGSISGNEYATGIHTPGTIHILEESMDILEKYTTYNKECSLHIHFGGYPISKKAIYTLYRVCRSVQGDFKRYLSNYCFQTSMYKRTGKDYCLTLPNMNSFSEMYRRLSGGVPYADSLSAPHPMDEHKEHKWNIKTRYYWANLINLLFYEDCKTVEFRLLQPTHSFKEVLHWIFILNGILIYAEKLANSSLYKTINAKTEEDLKILDILKIVYPIELYRQLEYFLEVCKYIKEEQVYMLNDPMCLSYSFKESIINNNVNNFLRNGFNR